MGMFLERSILMFWEPKIKSNSTLLHWGCGRNLKRESIYYHFLLIQSIIKQILFIYLAPAVQICHR